MDLAVQQGRTHEGMLIGWVESLRNHMTTLYLSIQNVCHSCLKPRVIFLSYKHELSNSGERRIDL